LYLNHHNLLKRMHSSAKNKELFTMQMAIANMRPKKMRLKIDFECGIHCFLFHVGQFNTFGLRNPCINLKLSSLIIYTSPYHSTVNE
jgi:hypothetical protein